MATKQWNGVRQARRNRRTACISFLRAEIVLLISVFTDSALHDTDAQFYINELNKWKVGSGFQLRFSKKALLRYPHLLLLCPHPRLIEYPSLCLQCIWLIIFFKNGHHNIQHPKCSYYKLILTLFPLRSESSSLPLDLRRASSWFAWILPLGTQPPWSKGAHPAPQRGPHGKEPITTSTCRPNLPQLTPFGVEMSYLNPAQMIGSLAK